MQKWTIEDAGPIQVSRFKKVWDTLDTEHYRIVELRGIVGESEDRSEYKRFSIGGANQRREEVAQLQERIGNDYGWRLTRINASFVVKDIEAAILEARKDPPVLDKRETREQVDVRVAESRRFDEEHKARQQAELEKFIALYGTGDTVTVESDRMCMVVQLCYDNSDVMSDYHCPHATLSPAFALLVVREQRKTEALAREAVALSPLLAGASFKWHVENWSMGHGNYLQSEAFELPEELKGIRTVYGGDGVTHGHWEIKFAGKGEYPAFQGYRVLMSSIPAEPVVVTDGSITVSENTEKNGIEIRFAAKPGEATLNRLRSHGWRWARGSCCWYKRASDSARAFANEMSAA